MPPSILSTSVSTQKDIDALPIVNYRLVDFDTNLYRRQIEHFEWYWGLQKGELDLSTPLNHIKLRSDMVERLDKKEWTIIPTKRTLDTINALSDFNKTADVHKRRRFTEVLPEQEYEYDFVPLRIAKGDRPSMYLKRGSTTKTINKAYSKMPRIKSRAHPLFVIFHTDNDILSAYDSIPEAKEERLFGMTHAVLNRWLDRPPIEFLVGPDVWAKHRHPWSDDGYIARTQLSTCKPTPTKKPARAVRKSTRAPSPQPKTQARPSIYDHARNPPPRPRSPALPRSSRASSSATSASDADVEFSAADLQDWLSSIKPEPKPKRAFPPSPRRDAVLARYRKEPARAPANALRVSLLLVLGGLVAEGNDGTNREVYTSNDWATINYRTCLWSSNPPKEARTDYIDLIP
ncbi:uncharacterized protein SCHCODRAFT_02672135 [Schizophyllum commune H4-8]|nr:uncharacterized protein SCHCODRAFT_02672135 [Schizophyllum commune H4-8]KAI5886946.1 hypothetical protein SCHCODRAFT_02672135 [Schizophyllum commune H4-8]